MNVIKDLIVSGMIRIVGMLTANSVIVIDELQIPTTAPSSPVNGDIWIEP